MTKIASVLNRANDELLDIDYVMSQMKMNNVIETIESLGYNYRDIGPAKVVIEDKDHCKLTFGTEESVRLFLYQQLIKHSQKSSTSVYTSPEEVEEEPEQKVVPLNQVNFRHHVYTQADRLYKIVQPSVSMR